jgi:cell division protein FtsI/penicillin-binding protein 2
VVGAVAVLALSTSLAGCTHHTDDDEAGLTTAANGLAAALVDSRLGEVPITGATPQDATAERKAVFAQLPTEPKVAVTKVATVAGPDGKDQHDNAVATLAWTWPLGSDAWTYTTTAKLVRATSTAGSATASGDAPTWQVAWSPALLLPGLTNGQHVTVAREVPKRANIVDGSGKAIVKDRAVHRVGIDKTAAKPAQWKASARALATKLGLDPDAYAKQVAAAGPKAFVEAIVLRADDPTDLAPIEKIAGVNVVNDSMPLGPTRTWARPLLGTVGDATSDIVAASGGRIAAGEQTGLSGLERQYDAQLAGAPGVAVKLADDSDAGDGTGSGSGSGGKTLYRVDVVHGTPLKLTLDSGLQTDAEKILASQTSASAVVAIDTSGKVLTAASGAAGNGLSTATLGQYAPGSTMKIATSLALLRTGDTDTSKVTCTPSLTVDGRKFTNDDGYPTSALGKITLRSAFANSCNTAFMSQAPHVSQSALHDAAASLGLGVPSALGAPAFFGNVPATATSETDHAASMIGQGRVEASPLAMATVGASVAAGRRVSPVLVSNPGAGAGGSTAAAQSTPTASPTGATATTGATPSPSPSPSPTSTPSAPPRKLTSAETTTLHSLMRSVVTEGTGTILDSLPNDVAAKTGTAQYGDGSKQHAWMVGIDGDVAVAVFVDDGSYGATTAGPLLKEFLQDVDASGLAKG